MHTRSKAKAQRKEKGVPSTSGDTKKGSKQLDSTDNSVSPQKSHRPPRKQVFPTQIQDLEILAEFSLTQSSTQDIGHTRGDLHRVNPPLLTKEQGDLFVEVYFTMMSNRSAEAGAGGVSTKSVNAKPLDSQTQRDNEGTAGISAAPTENDLIRGDSQQKEATRKTRHANGACSKETRFTPSSLLTKEQGDLFVNQFFKDLRKNSAEVGKCGITKKSPKVRPLNPRLRQDQMDGSEFDGEGNARMTTGHADPPSVMAAADESLEMNTSIPTPTDETLKTLAEIKREPEDGTDESATLPHIILFHNKDSNEKMAVNLNPGSNAHPGYEIASINDDLILEAVENYDEPSIFTRGLQQHVMSNGQEGDATANLSPPDIHQHMTPKEILTKTLPTSNRGGKQITGYERTRKRLPAEEIQDASAEVAESPEQSQGDVAYLVDYVLKKRYVNSVEVSSSTPAYDQRDENIVESDSLDTEEIPDSVNMIDGVDSAVQKTRDLRELGFDQSTTSSQLDVGTENAAATGETSLLSVLEIKSELEIEEPASSRPTSPPPSPSHIEGCRVIDRSANPGNGNSDNLQNFDPQQNVVIDMTVEPPVTLCCKTCGMVFSIFEEYQYIKHMTIIHGIEVDGTTMVCDSKISEEMLVQCRKCDVILIQKHAKTHFDKCQLQLTTKPGMEFTKCSSHFPTSSQKPFLCDILDCSVAFSTKTELENHFRTCHQQNAVRMCLGGPQLRCKQCLETFVKPADLLIHCGQCGVNARPSNDTMAHLAQNLIICEICEKKETNLDAVLNCYLAHQIFKCVLCLAIFKTKEALVNHIELNHNVLRQVDGKNIFQCTFCDLTCHSYEALEMHALLKHLEPSLHSNNKAVAIPLTHALISTPVGGKDTSSPSAAKYSIKHTVCVVPVRQADGTWSKQAFIKRVLVPNLAENKTPGSMTPAPIETTTTDERSAFPRRAQPRHTSKKTQYSETKPNDAESISIGPTRNSKTVAECKVIEKKPPSNEPAHKRSRKN